MGIKLEYKQIQEDFEYLVKHHGNFPDDMSGGWSADDKILILLRNPCKQEAINLYNSLIQCAWALGFEGGVDVDTSDEQTMEIFERHYCNEIFPRNW